jgi:hypothetical protein
MNLVGVCLFSVVPILRYYLAIRMYHPDWLFVPWLFALLFLGPRALSVHYVSVLLAFSSNDDGCSRRPFCFTRGFPIMCNVFMSPVQLNRRSLACVIDVSR